MQISFDISEKEFTDAIEAEAEDAMEKIFADALRRTPSEWRELMANSPATGKKYAQKSGEGFQRFAVASSKGSPPRNQSFALSRSFQTRKTSDLEGEGTMLWYGAFHDENGREFIEKGFDNAVEKAL